jgi:7-cyano-7-deazaguanine synthase
MIREKAVVLLSGGLDSATVLAIAVSRGMEVTALSFSYGQKHRIELEMAKETATHFKVKKHLIIELDPEPFKGSSLTDGVSVPEHRDITGLIPSTYVPARNTVFLAMALGIAESTRSNHIFIGVNSLDYSGYPDCRPEFIEAFQNLANLATKAAVDGNPTVIQAPLIHMTKAEIIQTGVKLGVDYSRTLSCYQPAPGGISCGVCDSCTLRLLGFKANGITDPARYKAAEK